MKFLILNNFFTPADVPRKKRLTRDAIFFTPADVPRKKN